MAIRHVPIRTCIATGEKRPKNEMIRLVRLDSGEVVIDLKGKEKGRGANLTQTSEAFDLAVKKKIITKALKLEKPLSADKLSSLREKFLQAIEEKAFRQGQKHVKIKVSKEQLD